MESGTRLGAYEITGRLGAGGMGEVYRARDTRLNRDVAIKVLPASFAADPERSARFTREAHALAALNHPHIGAIYGFEDARPSPFLVLELVDGETLDARIARGPLPLDEALAIATEIALALEAAHERGIVHRDLKPSNIALTRDGHVKVLDFGLAKLVVTEPAGAASISLSPTLTSPAMTAAGMLLGTVVYMSPEQAKGREADRRSDVWAFGCVLYEMVTGTRAFDGEDVSETIASILRGAPDWSKLPASTPQAVRVLLKGCLERHAQQRLGDLSAARLLIAEAARLEPAPAAAGPAARSQRTLLLPLAAIVLAGLVVAVATYRGPRTPDAPVRILELSLPAVFNFGAPATAVLSPDGTRLAYIAQNEHGRLEILVKDLDGIKVARLVETNGAHSPFWSADGRWLAYYDGNRLMRATPAGGPPEALASLTGQARGGAWNDRGDILFTDGGAIKRLAVGTNAEPPATVVARGRYPAFLPDGQRFLYFDPSSNALFLTSLAAAEPRRVVSNAGQPLLSRSGHLLFPRDRTLMVAGFDGDAGMITSEPVALQPRIYHLPDTGGMGATIDDRGTLIVSAQQTNQLQFHWYDLADGTRRPTRVEPFSMGGGGFDVAPDGLRAAAARVDEASGRASIWIVDLARGTIAPLTQDGVGGSRPVWSPDGKTVVYSRGDGGRFELVAKPVDRPGEARVVAALPALIHANAWTPDATNLVVMRTGEGGSLDLWLQPASGPVAARPLVASPANDVQGQVSPDGMWLAFASDETGTMEVYVQRLADGAQRTRVSVQGGHMPRWKADGSGISYVMFTGDLMSAAFDSRSATFGEPTRTLRLDVTTRNSTFRYALVGNRLLVAESADGAAPQTVVLNWPSLLQKP